VATTGREAETRIDRNPLARLLARGSIIGSMIPLVAVLIFLIGASQEPDTNTPSDNVILGSVALWVLGAIAACVLGTMCRHRSEPNTADRRLGSFGLVFGIVELVGLPLLALTIVLVMLRDPGSYSL
jgi:hypothetical protein